MRSLLLATACLALATPALADVTVTIENRSSATVSGINSFPIGDDGEAIEDNIGGLIDDVAPGTKASFELNGECGPTRLFVRLLDQTGDDLEIDLDTCRRRTIVVSD